MKTAKQILEEWFPPIKVMDTGEQECILEAMEEYAAQQQPKLPSEAEIDAANPYTEDKAFFREKFWKEGAMWLSQHLQAGEGEKPKVVCFCGSTRFAQYFMVERWLLEKQGIITLGINILPDGYFAGEKHHGAEQEGVKHILDELHKRKIDLADEVVILNVGGYIGESTRAELDYALSINKPVRYFEPLPSPPKTKTDE